MIADERSKEEGNDGMPLVTLLTNTDIVECKAESLVCGGMKFPAIVSIISRASKYGSDLSHVLSLSEKQAEQNPRLFRIKVSTGNMQGSLAGDVAKRHFAAIGSHALDHGDLVFVQYVFNGVVE